MNPQPPPQPTLSENLVKSLEGLPTYILSYFVGFFILLITDVIVTSLAIGCILLTILTHPLIALAVFLFGYTVVGIIGGISNALKISASMMAQQINFTAQVMSNNQASPQ